MLINLIKYFLVFAAGSEILLIWLLLRQNNKSFFRSTFIYIVVLFLIDTIAALFIMNPISAEISLGVFNTRLIVESFIIAILYNFTLLFSFSGIAPKLSLKNTFTFIIAFILSIAGSFGLLVENFELAYGIYLPVLSKYYWAFIIFFLGVFYLIFIDIIPKYRFTRRQHETGFIKEILIVILPLAFLTLSSLYISPILNVFHPICFLSYFIIAGLLIYGALRFQILENEEYLTSLISHQLTAGLILLVFFLVSGDSMDSTLVFLSIPGFCLLALSMHYLSFSLPNHIKKFQSGHSENLDQKIGEFSISIVKFIDGKELWKYLADFLKETFRFQKVATVSFQYDVSPYQIEFLVDFDRETFKKLLSERNSPLLETLESDRRIINKFDEPNDSLLFQRMDSMNIYLVIPLVKQNEILGIVFLGGDRRVARIPQRHIQLIKLISSQAAFALDNIQTIQKNLQATKMAEIGMLASQLAHDFQSFISIAKLENRGNSRLNEHANYTEKLIQDLLNYARPQELNFNPININHLIDMSLDLVDLPQNIVIEKHYSDDFPEINVDVNQMRRVFTNLIENSSLAMKNTENKRVKITTRPLRPLSKVQRNPWIYIEILDEGDGIPEEQLEKIFDPFFTTRKSAGGNGMGLAIVKQIINRHQGFIDVTSRPGKGTIFNIRLPYRLV